PANWAAAWLAPMIIQCSLIAIFQESYIQFHIILRAVIRPVAYLLPMLCHNSCLIGNGSVSAIVGDFPCNYIGFRQQI
ncbi:MAG: hypothetical protein ACI955_002376, partial [Zhongshania sp.]